MDPAEERWAIKLREEADRLVAAINHAAALREAEPKKAIIEDAALPTTDKPEVPGAKAPAPLLQ